jgi:hypothetical protein
LLKSRQINSRPAGIVRRVKVDVPQVQAGKVPVVRVAVPVDMVATAGVIGVEIEAETGVPVATVAWKARPRSISTS